MQLLQWLLPLPGGGVASAITRRDAKSLDLPDVEGERVRGPIVECPELLLPLTVGRPPDEQRELGAPVHHLHLTLSLLAEGQPDGSPLLGEREDDVGVLSLFAEYLRALAHVVDALGLPLAWLSPTSGGTFELRLGPLPAAWDARNAAWTMLLLAGAADVLARARGFRVSEARARADQGAWQPVDDRLPEVLAPT